MASAFYWMPGNNPANLQTINISGGVSTIEVNQSRMGAAEAVSIGGVRRRYVGRASRRIIIGLESDASDGLRRELESMMSHLHLGGWVAFAGDVTTIGAAWLSGAPLIGATLVTAGAYPFAAPASPSVSLSIGTEVRLEGSNAAIGQREVTTITGVWSPGSSGPVTISNGVRYDYTDDTPVLIRTRDYYPRLVWPVGGRLALASTRLRLQYDYVLELAVDIGGLQSIGQAGT